MELDVLGRVIGPGTAFLDALRPGDQTEIVGPLGRAFSVDQGADQHILLAGGIGLPPLLWLAERLHDEGRRCVAVCGAASGDLLPMTLTEAPRRDARPTACVAEFARLGISASVTTDDGTVGLAGRATDALELLLNARDEAGNRACVYACGPEAMLRAAARICAARSVRCFVCMERMMACGMGTCQSCVVPIRDSSRGRWHYELCCTQGPVFDAAAVVW